MDECIEVIEEAIRVKRLNNKWEYSIDLANSCISSDQYKLSTATISGNGTLHDSIRVNVEFMIHNSDKINVRSKIFKGIERAIRYIWDFPENFFLCPNCCNLVKKNMECKKCIFFKSYLTFKNKKELCGICQEETFRTILPCKHHFHKICILKMDPYAENLKCPLCRHPIDEDLIYDLFDTNADEEIIEETLSDDEI